MDRYDVKRLALVLAIQAEIEGMKSHNKYAPKSYTLYTQYDFDAKAEELRVLASLHNEQL